MKNPILFLTIFLIMTAHITAQPVVNPKYQEYIMRYKDLAIREMKLYRIPASITLAQGLIESNIGGSALATQANNHFGIKCTKEWSGDTFFYDDDEKNECFRKYRTDEESYRDHSLFLTSRARYSELFTLDIRDYAGWARALKKAGYATNPAYADILIRIIEENQLYLYDQLLPEEAFVAVTRPDSLLIAEAGVKNDIKGFKRLLFRSGYIQPSPGEFRQLYTSDRGRKVYENNGIPFIFALPDDTYEKIAGEFAIFSYQVYRQNDLTKHDKLVAGQMIYLEPKKARGYSSDYRITKYDSLYSVSQQFGIKLKKLLDYNGFSADFEPEPGTVIKLWRR